MSNSTFSRQVLILRGLLSLLVLPGYPPAQAQEQDCYWNLLPAVAKTYTAPSAEGATATTQGTSIFVSYQGLSTTHTWIEPPATLVPGQEIGLDISAGWDYDRSSSMDLSGGVKTTLQYDWVNYLEAGKSAINFQTEPHDYLYQTLTYIVPSGTRGANLQFMVQADAGVGGGNITYKYEFVCPESDPVEPFELKYGTWEISGVSRIAEVFYPVGVDKNGELIYEDEPRSLKMFDKLPVGAKIVTGEDSLVRVFNAQDNSVLTLKAESEIILWDMPAKKDLLEINWGRFKLNLQRVLRGESIDVKTNWATVGIKGTVFVLEVTADQTTLKVIEGEVELTAHADGSSTLVNPGEMASAGPGGLSAVSTFDIQAELAGWPDADSAATQPAVQSPLFTPLPEPSQVAGAPSGLEELPPASLSPKLVVLGLVILLVGLAACGLFAVLAFVILPRRRQALGQPKAGGGKRSFTPIQMILIIGMLIGACLVSSLCLLALYLSYRPPTAATSLPEPARYQTMTALAQLEQELILQMTQNAQNQQPTATQVPPQATPTAIQPPAPSPEPADTQPPAPTLEPATTSGSQSRDDHSLVDDFSTTALGWPVYDDGQTILQYENGAYSFQVKEPGLYDWAYFPVDFYPSEISFDVSSPQAAQDGTFGIFCHYQDEENYYYVEFDLQMGEYTIVQKLDGEHIPLTAENELGQYWHPVNSIKPAGEVNHMNIGCYLGTIFLIVNDEIIAEAAVGQPFESQGQAAFFVYTFDFAGEDGYKVFFDNVAAYAPVQ
jgi:hypothetical protein